MCSFETLSLRIRHCLLSNHTSKPATKRQIIYGVQRILGYGRPQRIGAVCPPRAGERKPHWEDRPSNASFEGCSPELR